MTDPTPPDVPPGQPSRGVIGNGPLTREQALALLDRAAELFELGEYPDAANHYRRVVGFDDAGVTGSALLGLGQALYRLDDEAGAVATWESVLELPENPATYRAWREVAAARVREGDLGGAATAYREADRRAPPEDKAEIAARLGWLAKETGNAGAARRYFSRSRGNGSAVMASWIVIGLTVVVSLTAMSMDGLGLYQMLWLDKLAVADGEYWRLWTVTLVHAPGNLLHLGFNMYALFIVGPLVERLYGMRLFILFYLLCAAGGSIGSFVFGGPQPSVGASGAVFGFFGLVLASTRRHVPLIDRRSRALVAQIGTLILINLAFGVLLARFIDNAAHIGGLLTGLWLGFLIAPGKVPTMRTAFQRPGQLTTSEGMPPLMSAIGVAFLVLVLAIGIVVGTDIRRSAAADPPAGPTITATAPVDRAAG